MPVDYSGRRYGKLTVVRETGRSHRGKRVWVVRCDCGVELERAPGHLHVKVGEGFTPSCGGPSCRGKRGPPPGTSRPDRGILNAQAVNVAGVRFGRLVAVSPVATPIGVKWNGVRWRCACECGRETVVRLALLSMGQTRSCGCLRRTPTRRNWPLANDAAPGRDGERRPSEGESA